MAEIKVGHESALAAAKEEQDRIKQEIETLQTSHQNDLKELKEQHEKNLQEARESEKVN